MDPGAAGDTQVDPPTNPDPGPARAEGSPGLDPRTTLLTRAGWKPVAEVTRDDEVATLDRRTDALEYQRPTRLHSGRYEGPMYLLDTQVLDLLVAPHQRLWVARPGSAYRAVTAAAFHASKNEWQFKKDCTWAGVEREWMEFEPFDRYTSRTQYLDRVPMDDWLEFLGYYLSEGRAYRNPASGADLVQVSQFRTSDAWQAIHDNLERLGLRARYNQEDQRFEIYSLWLHGVLAPLGDSYTKHIPAYVQELAPRQLRIFLDAYLAGDGHLGASWEYGSSSQRLAFDVSVVCLKLGWCVRMVETNRTDNWQKRPHWRCRIIRRMLRPWWKKGRAKVTRRCGRRWSPTPGRSTAWRCPTGWSTASGGASRTGCATAADRPGPPINPWRRRPPAAARRCKLAAPPVVSGRAPGPRADRVDRPRRRDQPDIPEINVYSLTVEETRTFCAGSILVAGP